MNEVNDVIEEAMVKNKAELDGFRLDAINGLNEVERMLLQTRSYHGGYTRLQNCDKIIYPIIEHWLRVKELVVYDEFSNCQHGPCSMAEFQEMAMDGLSPDMPGGRLGVADGRIVSYTGSPDNINPEAFVHLRSNLLLEAIPEDLQFLLECLIIALKNVAEYYEKNQPE